MAKRYPNGIDYQPWKGKTGTPEKKPNAARKDPEPNPFSDEVEPAKPKKKGKIVFKVKKTRTITEKENVLEDLEQVEVAAKPLPRAPAGFAEKRQVAESRETESATESDSGAANTRWINDAQEELEGLKADLDETPLEAWPSKKRERYLTLNRVVTTVHSLAKAEMLTQGVLDAAEQTLQHTPPKRDDLTSLSREVSLARGEDPKESLLSDLVEKSGGEKNAWHPKEEGILEGERGVGERVEGEETGLGAGIVKRHDGGGSIPHPNAALSGGSAETTRRLSGHSESTTLELYTEEERCVLEEVNSPQALRELAKVKTLPDVHCSVCTIGPECPEFKEGFMCAYDAAVEAFDLRDPKMLLPAMVSIVNENQKRLRRAQLTERLINGGEPRPDVTQLSSTVIQQMETIRKMTTVAKRATLTVAGEGASQQGGGVLSKLLASMTQPTIVQVEDRSEEKV